MLRKAFDIIVAGAGPAGSTFVTAMRETPYSIAVIDKAVFPRDKVCGDAIPGRAVRVIRSLSAEISDRFSGFTDKHRIRGARAVAPGGKSLELRYQTEGYTSPRMAFDNFLYQEATRHPGASFLMGRKIRQIRAEDKGVSLILEGDQVPVSGRLLIGCDGANSVAARQMTGRKVDHDHHCGAVRAYFHNVTGAGSARLEAYLLRDYLPGYFWIFPLPGNLYNVGFGMLSKDISKKGIKLKKAFEEIIRNEPKIRPLFEQARMVGEVEGFGLPLGSRRQPISGDHFMLTGDAAGLIDPASGEGIGNALLSARLAADVAVRALECNDFSAAFLKAYDRLVYHKLGRELRNKYYIQRLLKDRSWLIDLLIGQAAGNPFLKKVTGKLF